MGVPAQRVDALLELVGLDETAARRRVGKYSLGMRQRLGLAHALLGDPEVLILDEPANGLDPEGMRWMRELLRGFADRGGTVLLSSHLLAEVEAVADRMIIIGGGRIQAQGTRAELLHRERDHRRGRRPRHARRRACTTPAWRRTPPTAIGGWSRPSPRSSPAWRWPTTSCCAGSPRPTRRASNASSSS